MLLVNKIGRSALKILLTGHKGYIGKVLKFRLESIGHEVEGFEWSDGSFPDVMGYNHIIHLGAISSTTETDLDKIMVQNHDFCLLYTSPSPRD